eukprot:1089494-Prymnesium_polylepis.1
MDCADLVENYAALLHAHPERGTAARVAAEDALLKRREALFKICKGVSGSNRLSELKKHIKAYGIDPHSRYVNVPPSLPAALYQQQ